MSGEVSAERVLEALAQQPRRSPGAGRALMLIAAQRRQGVTTLARAVALAAPGPIVYAIDLDVRRNALARAFSAHERLGASIDGRIDGEALVRLAGRNGRPMQAEAPFGFRRLGQSRVFVSVFKAAPLPEDAQVIIDGSADYWVAARAGGVTAIVDAPALERSDIGLRVARHMDGVVLAVGDGPGAAPAAIAAKQKLLKAGANLIGLAYAGEPSLPAMDRLKRHAG